jgi:hypothetical protein
MRKMKAVLSAMILASAPLLLAGIPYEPGKLDAAKLGGKLVKGDPDVFRKYQVKKLAIVECTGEFLQSREVSAGAFEQRASMMQAQAQANLTNTPQWVRIRSSKSSITMDESYYHYAVDQVYELVAAIFSENGIEVIPRDVIGANAKYKAMELDRETSTKGYTGGMFKDSVVKKGAKVSATNLGVFPTSPFKAMKMEAISAGMAGDLGADSLACVNFFVDKGKNGEPILARMNITLKAGLKGEMRGFKGSESMVYEFKYTSGALPVLEMKDSLVCAGDISGAEKNSISLVKYHDALLGMANTVVDLYKDMLTKSLQKK